MWSAIALAATLIYLLGGQGIRLVGLAMLVLFASAAIGAIAGFLFGVPKSVPYVPSEGAIPPPYVPMIATRLGAAFDGDGKPELLSW